MLCWSVYLKSRGIFIGDVYLKIVQICTRSVYLVILQISNWCKSIIKNVDQDRVQYSFCLTNSLQFLASFAHLINFKIINTIRKKIIFWMYIKTVYIIMYSEMFGSHCSVPLSFMKYKWLNYLIIDEPCLQVDCIGDSTEVMFTH